MAEYAVEIQPDFLARQTKAQPVAALAELIWNCLDADSTEILIDFDETPLGGMTAIRVSDNGHGVPHGEAPVLFRSLGGSWKQAASRTKTGGRMLHGREGKGRFKAFALGAAVDWMVTYTRNGTPYTYAISIRESDLRRVSISDEVPVHGPASIGVTATVSELKADWSSLRPERAVQALSEIFAIYLKNYRDAAIVVAGTRVEPEAFIAHTSRVELSPVAEDGGAEHPVSLEVIEWRGQANRTLFLCNEYGFPLSEIDGRFHVGDFQFSAYLKSTFFDDLNKEGRLELATMIPAVASVVAAARNEIKGIFRERASERAHAVVENWKSEGVYPYAGEPVSAIEHVERQVFDIVAVTVQDASPDFTLSSSQQKALHLQLLRSAVEHSPNDLQRILAEVVKLPKRKQKELVQLLEETDLSAIISSASLIGDRLKFLQGLRLILFEDGPKQRLKERTQLHKILESNTWLFGEGFNLWASDQELTTVLKAHRDKLDPDLVIDEAVKLPYRQHGIVDLVLARAQKCHRANDFEYLVVELKAPKVVLGAKEVGQIKDYAYAVAEDPRYHRIDGVRWHFWLISDEYDQTVARDIRGGPDPLRSLVHKADNITITIRTWGEVLAEVDARLQFVKEKLEHHADDGQALRYLQQRYHEFLEGVIAEDEPEGSRDAVVEGINSEVVPSEPELLPIVSLSTVPAPLAGPLR
jgi:hypothetical protein